MYIKKITTICFFSFLLISCNKTYTHEYLLQHPEILQRLALECDNNSGNASYCDMVKHTAEQFVALANVRQEDPELFGKQILQTQYDMAAAKEAYKQAKEDLEKLQLTHASQSDLKAVQDKVSQTNQTYTDLVEKNKDFLAVVAATGSEGL